MLDFNIGLNTAYIAGNTIVGTLSVFIKEFINYFPGKGRAVGVCRLSARLCVSNCLLV